MMATIQPEQTKWLWYAELQRWCQLIDATMVVEKLPIHTRAASHQVVLITLCKVQYYVGRKLDHGVDKCVHVHGAYMTVARASAVGHVADSCMVRGSMVARAAAHVNIATRGSS